MTTYDKKYTLIILLLFLLNNLFAQDSLYLITSFTGKNIDNKLSGIINMGDLNGDGYNEIGMKEENTNYFDIFFGNEIFNKNNKIRFFTHKDFEGNVYINKVGDVNGDGYDDFIVSGSCDSPYVAGKLLLYFGSDTLDTIPDFSFEDIYSKYLVSNGYGGDINGDGYSDFTVVKPGEPMLRPSEVYLFLGGETIVDTPYVKFTDNEFGDFLGLYISDLSGDINGDNFNDLLITDPYLDVPTGTVDTLFSHTCYLFYGNTTIPSTFNYSFSMGINERVTIIGDANNDGFDDFLISEGSSDPKLYFGSENFSENDYLEFLAYKDIDNFGTGFGGIGDINNDGFNDFAINIKNFINNQNIMVSKLNIYLGATVIDTIPDFSLEGETKWGHFGRNCGSLGDINGDGYDEFYVSAPNYPDSENPLGKVYIYSMKKFLVSVEEEKQTKVHYNFDLFQNYPNPFNPSTIIKYSIPQISSVKLSIYNMMGQLVKTLVNETQVPGSYNVEWNGTNEDNYKVSSGIYFYRLESGNFIQSNKMILLK